MELQLIAYWYEPDDILNVSIYEKMFATAVMLWRTELKTKMLGL